MKNLYFIGGPMGVGKTAVGRELKNILEDCVFLDGDNLWDMRPFVVNNDTKNCVVSNIVGCLNSFITCPQFKNIIFCWVLNARLVIDGILSRLNLEGVRVINISLVCTPHVLAARLARDIRAGIRDRAVKERALKYLSGYAELSTVKVDTTKITAREAAEVVADL